MEEIFALLDGFDLNNFIPELDTVLGQVELIVRICVLAVPLVVLALGLWYYFLPPKEANHYVGFRTFWGMSSVGAWRFAQRLAGIVWGALGLVLAVVMFFISLGFRGMDVMDMVWTGFVCVIWQLVLVLISYIGINWVIFLRFDTDGRPRKTAGK